jgi:hypothetical protein
MDEFSPEEVREALEPLASLISKSEKASRKLAPETWQYSMLQDNVKALRLASALIVGGIQSEAPPTRDDLDQTRGAIESMIAKTEGAQSKFSAGTSQHTLLLNRLKALRVAAVFVRSAMETE